MAIRPLFVAKSDPPIGVDEIDVEFHWHPGLARSQKQKSVTSLHDSVRKLGLGPALEISSKSELELGIALSSFNLRIQTSTGEFSVETLFQGSKVFEQGGPFTDLIGIDSLTAKRDPRLRESGRLTGFRLFGQDFPSEPKTFFYDWLYINALVLDRPLASAALDFRAFTDIEFNPSRSLNCQARSAALFVSINQMNALRSSLESPTAFLSLLRDYYARDRSATGTQLF